MENNYYRNTNRRESNGRSKNVIRPKYDKRSENERLKQIKIRARKYRTIRFVFIFVLFFLTFQIFTIKAEHGEDYSLRAINQLINNNIENNKPVSANRGGIFDRNNRPFAVSRTVYTLYVDIKILSQLKKDTQKTTLEALNKHLGIDMQTLNEYLSKNPDGTLVYDTNYKVLANKLSRELKLKIEAEEGTRCIYFEDDSERVYSIEDLAPQVIGFARGDNKWGLEKQYDELLSGTPGRIFRTYNATGSVVTERIHPIEGHSLITTIDTKLQKLAQDLSVKYCELYNAQNASAIVMNPNTGEVFAMAQYEGFSLLDPADISKVTPEKKRMAISSLPEENAFEALDKVWTNYNIASTFEPGSTFKPITVAMALEEGIITKDARFYCPGSKVVANRPIGCHKKGGHGNISLEEALSGSCNVAMMEIGEKVGRNIFYKYQKAFGYGEKTGIDLPYETSAENLLHSLSGLNVVELATSSFGQTFNATPIQSITAFAAVINGGNLVQPYIVSQIMDEGKNEVYSNKGTVARKVISKETSDYLRTALESVIKSGTGKGAKIPGYAIGGKTGTGEQGIRGTDMVTLTFIAYLPVDNPEYIAMVTIDKPDPYIEGQTTPAPMIQELLLGIIKEKSLKPDYIDGDVVDYSENNKMYTVENFVGMPFIEAARICNSIGLNYEVVGASGSVVTSQFPKADSLVPEDAKILLTIAPEEGYELVEIPPVTGLTLEQAAAILEAAGLACAPYVKPAKEIQTEKIQTEETEIDSTAETEEVDIVYLTAEEQTPGAGIKIPKDSQIRVTVYK